MFDGQWCFLPCSSGPQSSYMLISHENTPGSLKIHVPGSLPRSIFSLGLRWFGHIIWCILEGPWLGFYSP